MTDFLTKAHNPPEIHVMDGLSRMRRFRDQLRHYQWHSLTIDDHQKEKIRKHLGTVQLWINDAEKLL